MRERQIGLCWDDLRIFLAICRAKTLSGAASTLGVDDTTVGRKVERLEKALNVKLFERRSTGYAISSAGETLLRTAEQVESAIISGESELGEHGVALSGIVRIGAPDGFGSFFLAPHLAQFCRQHPLLEVQLIATSRLFSLSKREADIAIALDAPTQGRVVTKKLIDYRLGLYASRDYLAREAPIAQVADLKHHLFISYIDELLYSPLLDYVQAISREIKPRFKSGNLVAQFLATREGGGVAVLPAFMAAQDEALAPVLPDEVFIDRTLYLLVHEDNRNLARVRAAASFIYDEVQRQKPLFRGLARTGEAGSER